MMLCRRCFREQAELIGFVKVCFKIKFANLTIKDKNVNNILIF